MNWEGPWLAAIIEGEGYVSPEGVNARVTISNKNVFVLDMTARALESIGIDHYSCMTKSKDGVASIAVYSLANFRRLYEACDPYMVSWKKENLKQLASRISRPGGRRCDIGCECGRHRTRFKVGSRRHKRGKYSRAAA